jgi:hypothetical protein
MVCQLRTASITCNKFATHSLSCPLCNKKTVRCATHQREAHGLCHCKAAPKLEAINGGVSAYEAWNLEKNKMRGRDAPGDAEASPASTVRRAQGYSGMPVLPQVVELLVALVVERPEVGLGSRAMTEEQSGRLFVSLQEFLEKTTSSKEAVLRTAKGCCGPPVGVRREGKNLYDFLQVHRERGKRRLHGEVGRGGEGLGKAHRREQPKFVSQGMDRISGSVRRRHGKIFYGR